MQLLLTGLVLILIGLSVAQIWRATGFAREIEALNRRVGDGGDGAAVDLSTLPAVVVAFAERNGGRVGAAPVVIAEQQAEMRLAPDQAFFPLVATQRFGTRRPDFVWHSRATMLVVVPVEMVDGYVAGNGLLDARIASSISVAHGDGEVADRGEALRFLAELPFNPDAIVNAPMLMWSQLDASHVAVSMPVGDGEVTVILSFDAAGDVTGIEAQRPRMVGDSVVVSRWVGRLSDYAQIGAYRLPRRGEILWDLPEGEFVYWRGGMTSLTPLVPGD